MLTWENVYVGYKNGKGNTLFAKRAFKKNEPIFILSGPIVSVPSIYTIPIDFSLFIDPVPFDHPGRYLCHDCEPNAGIKDRYVVIAFRDIARGEEVAIDYAMIVYDYGAEMSSENFVCNCLKATCRHFLGSWKTLPDTLKIEYKNYCSEYLKRP